MAKDTQHRVDDSLVRLVLRTEPRKALQKSVAQRNRCERFIDREFFDNNLAADRKVPNHIIRLTSSFNLIIHIC